MRRTSSIGSTTGWRVLGWLLRGLGTCFNMHVIDNHIGRLLSSCSEHLVRKDIKYFVIRCTEYRLL